MMTPCMHQLVAIHYAVIFTLRALTMTFSRQEWNPFL